MNILNGTQAGKLDAPYAETVVLGALLHDQRALKRFSDLSREHFFTDANACMFDGICHLSATGEPITVHNLTLSLVDSMENAAAAVSALPLISADGALSSAETLREKHRDRTGRGIGKLLVEGKIPWDEAESQLGRLREYGEQPGPLFADVAAVIAGGMQMEQPTVAKFGESQHLFYAGRVNEIHGEPAVGKTNLMLASAIAVMREGGHVVYLDPEDNCRGIVGRLLALGCERQHAEQLFHYLQNPDPALYARAHEWTASNVVVLVILDGLAEALAAFQLDENNPGDILSFFKTWIRPFTDTGAAVAISDHVTKGSEDRGRWARGSGAKLGHYDGVSYEAVLVEGYTPKKAGAVRLKVAKDRNGGVGPVGMVVTELHFTPNDEGTEIEWQPPASKDDFMPTCLMGKICDLLKFNPDATARDVRKLGKADYVTKALYHLESLGHIHVQNSGPGKPVKYTLIKAFVEGSK